MKSLAPFLAIIMASLIFVSCGKKNDTSSSNEIIGKWTSIAQYEKYYVSGQLVYSDTIAITPPDYANIEFKTGNIFVSNSSIEGEEDHQTGYYKLQGNQVSVGETEADPDKEIYIYKLTGNNLTLSTSLSDTTNSVISKDELTIELKRQ